MSVYSDFNTYCTTNFGALTEPLVKATFGNTPAYVVAGDWTYPSRNSASIAFETTLPCKGRVEWGTTTAYGNLTALPDRFYYNHLHYLTGLTPGVTYHYRLVAVDESGVTVTSADRTITTLAMASAIAIPGGAYSSPYDCNTAGATYILTGNITAQQRAITISALNVTVDLNGYTISYDNAAPVNSNGIDDPAQLSSAGINFFRWNADSQNTLSRILNGTITQGSQNSPSGSIYGHGLNPVGIYYGKVEVAGITAIYTGADINGIDSRWGILHVHHNIIQDGGTTVTNRSQGIKAIYVYNTGSVATEGIHHNLIQRARHQAIMVEPRSSNAAPIWKNETYTESMATNSYAIGPASIVRDNKVFGTGYHWVGIDYLDHPTMTVTGNFVYGQGEAPALPAAGGLDGTTLDASVIGIRLTQYLGATFAYSNFDYNNNVVIVKGRNGTLFVRGVQIATSAFISGTRFRNNTVKCEMQDATVGSAICLQGDTTAGFSANALPCFIENNNISSNSIIVRFGEPYSCGGNFQFRNNTFTKIGALAGFKALYFKYADNVYDSYGNRFIDSVLGSGVALNAAALEGTRGRRDYSIGHSLYIRALGNGDVPLANATVTVNDSAGLSMTVTTDASGIARVEIIEDFYEALDGAGVMTHTTRSGWNLQTAGYGTRTLTAPELAVSNNSASPLAIRFGTGGPPADTTAPGAVTLAVGSATSTTLTLSWTAPGDDGGIGTATAYEVRRSIAPITEANFASATLCSGPPTPGAAGSAQQMVITGLQPGATWYFALRASDEVPNWGPVSNSPSGQTTPQPSDVTAPAAITDLSVGLVGAYTPGDFQDLRISWTAPGDDLGVGTAASYDLRFSALPIMSADPVPIITNGSLRPADTAQVTGVFIQDIGNNDPGAAAALAIASPGSILHFIPPCTPTYAAALAAICEADYQLTAVGGQANDWLSTSITAGYPDGAFGAPTAAAVVAGTLASRTFANAEVYVNLSLSVAVACGPAPGGSLPAMGVYVNQLTGYPATNAAGTFPQRGGIFWGQTTATNLAALALWRTWVGNNAQTEGPTDGVNSLTPVADWRAARAAAVPTHTAGLFFESHNGLGVYVNGAGAPNTYWPMQQRLHAFCQLDPTARWIYENGSPLQVSGGVSGSSTVRLFNIADDRLQEFFANEVLASVARCGADGAFGDEWHAIHPNRGALHPTVPLDAEWEAGMVRMCEAMNSDFAAADAFVGLPTPGAAGTAEHHDWTGVEGGSNWYFAIASQDEAGNVSLLSNVVRYTVPWVDTYAPEAVTTLAVTSTTATSATLQWIAPTEIHLIDGLQAAASYDLRYSTAPINSGNFAAATPVTGEPTPAVNPTSQTMTISGLTANTLYYFAIKSTDLAGNVSDISNVPSVTTPVAPDTTAPSAVSDLAVSIPTQASLRVTWTAPGDDAGVGTATAYDMRYSTAPITDLNFATRPQVTSLPTPGPAGTAESKIVTSVSANTLYYFAIKSVDEAGNWSAISNLPSGSTTAAPDVTAPSAISNLATTNLTSSSITLTWTAPGDDTNTGTATSYEIRYSTATINAGNFAAATLVSGPPTPAVAGTAQSKVVTGLTANIPYFFAMKASDEVPNVSGLSNVATGTTTNVADVLAPDAVVNLAVASVTQTTATLTWTAPGDDAAAGTAATYDIRYSTALITAGNFASATQVTGEPAPAVAGTAQAMTVTGLTAGTLYYFAMKTLDEVPNTSGLSNVATGTTAQIPDTTAPAAIANLTGAVRTQTTITLSWTAPGDDASSGIATQYDVRYSTSLIDAGNFAAAVALSGAPTPAVAGTTQTLQVTGLTAATGYYFAMKTADEAGNWSDISNVLSRSTSPLPADTAAPADTVDLAAAALGLDAVKLTWTAPGDDGTVGTVTTYDIRVSTSPITLYTFAGNTSVGSGPTPVAAGLAQSLVVNGLLERTKYYFALRAGDEAGNYSGLSNVAVVTTSIRGRYRMRVECTNRLRLRVEV